MTKDKLLVTVCELVNRTLKEKGMPSQEILHDTVLLGSSLGIDSLDLAAIVVNLSETTGRDPFENGFIEFRTAGELVALYCSGNGRHGD